MKLRHIKLFESFSTNETKDEANVSLKKIKKRKVDEATKEQEKSAEDRLSKLFNKLVPASGAAETVEGEMVRAIMRVWYRYFNDGDYFFRGYGKETAGPSVNWLKTQTPKDVRKQISAALNAARSGAGKDNNPDEFKETDMYLDGLVKAAEVIVDYVEGKKGQYEKNTADSR